MIEAGLFADIFNPDLNKQFKILNVYGPYVGKEAHWNKILGYQWFQDDNLILGGDLNLTVHKDEIWGSQGRVDKLSHFFLDRFKACNLIDVESVSLKPTRFNNRERADDIQKRLDRFLVKEEIFLSINHIRSWVDPRRYSDHWPILLELGKTDTKSRAPFKYNNSWSSIEEYKQLVIWTPCSPQRGSTFCNQIFKNMQNLKKATTTWAKARRLAQGKDILSIE